MKRSTRTNTARTAFGWALLVLLSAATLMLVAASARIPVPALAQQALVAALVLVSTLAYVKALLVGRSR